MIFCLFVVLFLEQSYTSREAVLLLDKPFLSIVCKIRCMYSLIFKVTNSWWIVDQI